MITGEHFEDLLAQGMALDKVLALAVAVADMRAVPERIEVTFSPDDVDTERQQSLPTWPAKYV